MARRDDVLRELNKDYETAAEWLLFYEDRKRQYYNDLNYIREESVFHEVCVKTGTGDVVLHKVISQTELDENEKWLLAIELVESMLGPKKKVFLDIRRVARRKNKTVNGHEVWRGYVQTNYAEKMAELNESRMVDRWFLSDRTITVWWQELVELTRLVALKRGCLKNF